MKKTVLLYMLAGAAFQLMCCPVFAQQKATRVACIGNSVTYGYGLDNREQNSYPARLQQLLGADFVVKNFGHSGATLLKAGHNPYFKTTEFSEALAFKPDIAVIDLGLNDTDPRDWPDYRQNFEADYAWLIAAFKNANPAVKIYTCSLTPVFSGHPRFKSGTRDWYWQIQQLIPQIAKANGAELIDLHEGLYNRPDLFADNVHPDKEGAAIIAKTVYQSLSGNFGGLKLSPVFADHMVLQRHQPIPVFGTANAGDMVTVIFKNQTLKAVAGKNGRWKVIFPPLRQGGPFALSVNCKDKRLLFNDILIGDVWLCSGQSNMAFPLKRASTGAAELASAVFNPNLRLFQFSVLAETDAVSWDTTTLRKVNQLDYFSGTWKRADQHSAANFSAVAYYFGKKIAWREQVPVGLIQVAVGGSPVESWIDRYTMEHDPVLVDLLTNWRKSDFMMKFCKDRADTNLKNAVNAKQRHPYEPCYNDEAGMAKLLGFPIKGVIWYQGESNTHNPELYEQLLPAMVNSWRNRWGCNLPFYFVQLSALSRPSWPFFRDMQRKLQKRIRGSAMAVSLDMGDSLNVHYSGKKAVGDRLALLALRYTYKRPVIARGPEPLYAVKSKAGITVTFPPGTHLVTRDHKPLAGFELVNEKGEHFCVKAVIKKDRVLLLPPARQQVKAVYYAMQPFTRANLINKAGLPASTFTLLL